MAIIYTPVNKVQELPLKVKQLRWEPLEARLREIIANLIAATR